MMIIFYLLSGGLSNASAVNAFVKGIQYVSPNRYSVELFFTLFIDSSPALCHYDDPANPNNLNNYTFVSNVTGNIDGTTTYWCTKTLPYTEIIL